MTIFRFSIAFHKFKKSILQNCLCLNCCIAGRVVGIDHSPPRFYLRWQNYYVHCSVYPAGSQSNSCERKFVCF